MFALSRAHSLARPELVESAGKVHDQTPLRSLVATIFEPYRDDKSAVSTRFIFTGPDLQISQHAVTNVALVLHELATNAAKYGSLSQAEGLVQISCSLEKQNLRLIWREEGGPEVAGEPENEGFGGVLVRKVIVNQFRGTLEQEWRPTGLVVRMEIPRPQITVQLSNSS